MPLIDSVVYRVALSAKDVARIKREFPRKVEILDGLLKPQSDFYNILLDSDTSQTIRREFGDALHDRLHAKAYELKGEKYYSYIIQLREILRLPRSSVSSILEVGPGYNILRALLAVHGFEVSTMDVKPEHSPTICGDLLHPPQDLGQYDLVCAFQVLQHIPSQYFRDALCNLRKCSRRYVFISLPCPMNHLYVQFRAEFVQRLLQRLSFGFHLLLPLPLRPRDRDEQADLKRPDKHNPHYWEANRRSFSKRDILRTIDDVGISILKQFHNNLHPYHWFVLGEIR